jgi:hypothetical protein
LPWLARDCETLRSCSRRFRSDFISTWTIVLLATTVFFAVAWFACEFGARRVSRNRDRKRIGED